MSNILFKNFTELNKIEKLQVLSWRNDPNIRIWMHNEQIIEEDSHFSFIESLKNNSQKLYFLVSLENKNIGVVYFTDITQNSAELGIYTNPDIKGFGKLLLNEICCYGFNKLKVEKLYAQVIENNIKAINLYNSFNFKQIKKETINNKTILFMELRNENWKI